MNENIENNDWKKDVPALTAMQKRNPFIIPNGYFESVEDRVKSAIFIEGLNKELNSDSFEVPQNYFENLSERIQTNVKLSALPKAEHSFSVPKQYFEGLKHKITDRIAAEQPIKTVKIIPLWRRNILKYASAACFVLMASFGTYFYQNNASSIPAQTSSTELSSDQLLYDIDENTIIEHLEEQNTTSANNTSASDTEMENYLLSNFSSSDLSHELNN